MFDVRLRIPELMERKDAPKTAYALAKRSGLSMTNAHHLVNSRGIVDRVELETLRKLRDAFGVKIQELFADD
jgi:DNA-binding Xre family transcriptional regulator